MPLLTNKKLLFLLNIFFINIIPLLGILIFDWELFEVLYAFIIETFVLLLISIVDNFFIVPKFKRDIPNAILNLIGSSVSFLAVSIFWSFLIFFVDHGDQEKVWDEMGDLPQRLSSPIYIWLLISIGLIDVLFYVLRKKYSNQKVEVLFWNKLKHVIYIHVFIGFSAILIGIFPYNHAFSVTVFIIAKMIVEYYMYKNEGNVKAIHF